ncbi:MAG: TlpA family protein disulfide reductase [Actinomycetota bacterium]
MIGRRWLAVGAVAVVVGALSLPLDVGLGRDPTLVRSVLVDRAAPKFTLGTVDGSTTVALSCLRGQVVVVNFWASWCAECRAEAPALQAAWERYRDRGVVILGVSYQDSVDGSLAFAAEFGKTYPLLSDADSGTAVAYGVTGIPETFFIDRRGRIAERVIGPVTYELLTKRIDALLGGR